MYSGSKVKLAFYQKPYILKDGVTYGTSLKLVGVQIVSLASAAGVDVGDMDDTDVAALFGTTKGYKASEPNVQNDAGEPEELLMIDFQVFKNEDLGLYEGRLTVSVLKSQ